MDEALLAAEALANAATPGPWEAAEFERPPPFPHTYDATKAWRIFLRGHVNPATNSRDCDWTERDAAFIAASRDLVPRLTAEVRRLLARQQELLVTIRDLSSRIPYEEEAGNAAALIAEVGTLRSQLRETWTDGVRDAITCVTQRQKHYELYRDGDAMRTHAATFATLDEVLVLLGAMLERGPRSWRQP